jgi:hypothetical protein
LQPAEYTKDAKKSCKFQSEHQGCGQFSPKLKLQARLSAYNPPSFDLRHRSSTTAMYSLLTLTTVLFLVAGAQAQFGPSVTSSSASLGPRPTESIGCRIVDGAWECSAPRTAADTSSTSSAASSSEVPTSTTPTETSSTSSTIPGPPVESVGCVAHGDHYHCEGPAEGYQGTTATGTAEPSIPSPTESSNCIWRRSVCFLQIVKLTSRYKSLGLLRHRS